MSKSKIIWISIVVWFIAIVFIFFDDELIVHYYKVKNENRVELNGRSYQLTNAAYLLGTTNDGKLAFGYNLSEIISIFAVEKEDTYISKLMDNFSSSLESIDVGSCIFLINNGDDKNLPKLSWYQKEYKYYFSTSNNNISESNFTDLCNILVKTKRIGDI